MTYAHIPVDDLEFAIQGASHPIQTTLEQTEGNPSLKLRPPAVGSQDSAPCLEGIPSIEVIEEALNAHVREGISPTSLLLDLMRPFEDIVHFDLSPGSGKLRPSYALSISPFDLRFGRSPTRDVAERLHALAVDIAEQPIGRRAPEGAADHYIEFGGYQTYPAGTSIKAPDHKTAARSYTRIFGRRPASIEVPIDMSAENLLEHFLCAREIITREAMGTTSYRRQALDLITASQDLRAIATVILRRNSDIRRYANFWITIKLGPEPRIDVTDNHSKVTNAHEMLAYEGLHAQLKTALRKAILNHPVLDILPEGYELRLWGETRFLSVNILDAAKVARGDGGEISSSLLEYSELEELSKRIERLRTSKLPPEETWKLKLEGNHRSRHEWTMSGPTLAHAIARKMREAGDRSSMVMFDLLIDLLADQDGEKTRYSMHRVFYDF